MSKRDTGTVTEPRTPNPENIYYQKRKRLNLPEYNQMANKRRKKAKFAASSRKRNRRK